MVFRLHRDVGKMKKKENVFEHRWVESRFRFKHDTIEDIYEMVNLCIAR
jgi:hypothetical protein